MYNTQFVTAFYDLGRSNWTRSKRSTQEYFDRFLLMANTIKNDFIVYSTKDIIEQLKPKVKSNVKFVEYDFFIECKYLIEQIDKVQKSEEFEKLYSYKFFTTAQRNVEYNKPEYSAVNCAKLWFIDHAVDNGHISSDFTGWVDFGYSLRKSDMFENDHYQAHWNHDRIRLFKLHDFDPKTVSIDDAMIRNKVYFTGGAYIGRKESFKPFRILWDELLERYWKRHMMDDDQGFLLASFLEKPEMFESISCKDSRDWRPLFRGD